MGTVRHDHLHLSFEIDSRSIAASARLFDMDALYSPLITMELYPPSSGTPQPHVDLSDPFYTHSPYSGVRRQAITLDRSR